MSRSAPHGIAMLCFFTTTLLAGCAAPEPGPRFSATVVGPTVTTMGGPDTAPLAVRQQRQAPPLASPVPVAPAASAQAPALGAAPLASNDHPEMTCAMHRKMMIAMTPEEREAVIAGHMREMSPEMRARYLKRLQNCTAQ